jgi:hypothetical protein
LQTVVSPTTTDRMHRSDLVLHHFWRAILKYYLSGAFQTRKLHASLFLPEASECHGWMPT